MKKLFAIGLIIAGFMVISGCKDEEAIKKYEREKEKLEVMKKEHLDSLQFEIACGASEWKISNLKIEFAEAEMKQAKKVERLARLAGLDDD